MASSLKASHLTNYKSSINESLWNSAPNIGMVNSSSNLSCIPWSIVNKGNRSLFMFFITVAPILCATGLFGNFLGLIFTFKERPHPNVTLTRALYMVNVFNCVFMLVYPILDLIGELKFLNFWIDISWNRYISDYHFPIAKSLVNFSFGIYATLALSQIIGTAFPFEYKIWFQPKNIVSMLVFLFIYVIVWCIPTKWWFDIDSRIKVCGVDPILTVYHNKICYPDTKLEFFSWTVYEVTREIFTKFLPALAILIVKIWTNKKKKSLLIRRINRCSNLSSNLLPQTSSKFLLCCRKSRVGDMSAHPNNDTVEIQHPTSKNNTVTRNPRLHARLRDNEVENKMIAIIGVEFIVFLFPVSIFLICRNFLIHKVKDYDIDIAFAFCTLMEYLYISLTFYLNLLFNPKYRRGLLKKHPRS
ncbi:unnamed protein product [Gordionus sp. m RMFG-2023]